VALGAGAAAAVPATAEPASITVQRTAVRALEAELGGLDASAAEAASAEHEAGRRLAVVRGRLRTNAAELRVAREDHRTAQRLLVDRLVAIYRRGSPTFAEILFGSGGLSATVDAMRTLERVGRQDAALVAGLTETRRRVAQARTRLLAARAETRTALAVAGARRRRLEGLVIQRRQVLVQAQRTLTSLIAAEARRVAAQRAERAAAAQAARMAALQDARERLQTRLAEPSGDPPPAPPTGSAPSSGVLESIAQCESGGNPRAVSAGGTYRGKYQFHPSTWRGVGGNGDPAAAPEAEQDRLAAKLYAQSGPAPWPVCGQRTP
jgi:peptidoglycan hydrolase CwlO-like protein